MIATGDQALSSKSGCCHPGCSVSVTRHPPSVTISCRVPSSRSTISRTNRPPGLTETLPRLVATAASVRFGPWSRVVTSANRPTFHPSTCSGACSTCWPSR
jgi:hypothetical protein